MCFAINACSTLLKYKYHISGFDWYEIVMVFIDLITCQILFSSVYWTGSILSLDFWALANSSYQKCFFSLSSTFRTINFTRNSESFLNSLGFFSFKSFTFKFGVIIMLISSVIFCKSPVLKFCTLGMSSATVSFHHALPPKRAFIRSYLQLLFDYILSTVTVVTSGGWLGMIFYLCVGLHMNQFSNVFPFDISIHINWILYFWLGLSG